MQKFLSQRGFRAPSILTIFVASVAFHVEPSLCLGHTFCHPLNVWCQEQLPLTSDISRLESLSTALLPSLKFQSFFSVLHFSATFSVSFPFPQLCSSSAIWLTAEADSGSGGGQMILAGKLRSFVHFGFNPRCYPVAAFYSYTTKRTRTLGSFSNQCFSLSKRSKLLSSAFPPGSNTMRFGHQ